MDKAEFRAKQREVLLKVVKAELLEDFSQDSIVKLLAAHQIPKDRRLHEELTDEEITYILPFKNGQLPTAERRMTRMAVCKLEKKALESIKSALAKYGIKELDDALDTKGPLTAGEGLVDRN